MEIKLPSKFKAGTKTVADYLLNSGIKRKIFLYIVESYAAIYRFDALSF